MPILLQIQFSLFKTGISAFVTAFVTAMIVMPPLIHLIRRFQLLDVPDERKEHRSPVPTMGGIATFAGLALGCALWYGFTRTPFVLSFFFSVTVLFVVGIFDDLRNTPARYKLLLQLAVALLMTFSGARITGLQGLFGIYELPLSLQYCFTVIAITGITNAFNLIDGIDGLAGGLGFMSLIMLGLFLTFSGDTNTAVIAFALGGGLLGFLYYNFNPARIFMGDTGSLVLGFTVAVLCMQLLQLNAHPGSLLPHAPVFVASIVTIPVFDTLRVFAIRLWQGRSPFSPDKNHIHHILTTQGWGHRRAARTLCAVHALVLMAGYWLKDLPLTLGLAVLFALMLLTVAVFRRLPQPAARKAVSLPFSSASTPDHPSSP